MENINNNQEEVKETEKQDETIPNPETEEVLKEEERLREELARLVSLSDERRRVLDDDTVVAFKQ